MSRRGFGGLGGQVIFLLVKAGGIIAIGRIPDVPVDAPTKSIIAVDAGDLNLVFQRKTATVADAQFGQGIGAARLLEDGFASRFRGLAELQGAL